MPLVRMNWNAAQWLTGASIAVAALAAFPTTASAQATGDSVSGSGKGIVGGALLGSEVVMLTMGAVGVEPVWPYLVFGGLGAVGGGIGGFFIEDAEPPAEVPLYMLAGGMALVIPTLVVTLNATAYKPPEADQSEPGRNEPGSELPQPGGRVEIKTSGNLRRFGLIDITPGRFTLGVPAPELRPLYSQAERARFGVTQGKELTFPVLRATF